MKKVKVCKFCGGPLEKEVKKCTTCGELCGLRGWVLRYVPLTTVILALGPLYIACLEIQATGHANVRATVAQSQARLAVSKLHVKERAADRALSEISRKLPESSRKDIVNDLRLPPRTTLEQLEKQAEKAPENSELQRKVFLYRALKQPD